MQRHVRRQLVLLFLCALALRLVFIYQGQYSPFFHNLIIDADKYSRDAAALVGGQGQDWLNAPFWQAPGYTLYLYVIYSLFGVKNLLAVRVIQALIDSASCVLVVLIGLGLGLRYRHAFAAGCVMAVYGPAVFFVGEIAIPVPLVFLMLLSVYVLLRLPDRVTAGRAVSCGALLGLAALFRPNALVLGLPFIVFLFREIADRAEASRGALLFVAGICLVVLPVSIRNYRCGGELILISHNGPVNLYVGNNPDWKETFNLRPGPSWEHLVSEPSRAVGPYRGVTPSKAGGYWLGKVRRYAFDEPGRFLWGLFEKTLLFLNYYELRRNTDIEFQKKIIPMFAWPVLPTFGIVAPFALVGVVFRTRDGRMWLALFIAIIYSASIIIFFVCGRYRLPICPFLAMFAVLGLDEMIGRAAEPATFMPRFVVLLLAVFVVHGDYVQGIDRTPAESFLYLARWQGRGKPEIEKGWIDLAYRVDPDSPEVKHALGRMLLKKGEAKEALKHFEDIVEKRPENWIWRKTLGFTYLALDKLDEAEQEFMKALALDPKYDEAYRGLGYVALKRRKFALAEERFRAALKFRPVGNYQARIGLAKALLLQYKNREAIEVLLELVRRYPQAPEPHRHLGYVYYEMGSFGDARFQFSQWRPREKKLEGERQFMLGLCNDKLGATHRALRCFKKAFLAGHGLHPDIRRKYHIGPGSSGDSGGGGHGPGVNRRGTAGSPGSHGDTATGERPGGGDGATGGGVLSEPAAGKVTATAGSRR